MGVGKSNLMNVYYEMKKILINLFNGEDINLFSLKDSYFPENKNWSYIMRLRDPKTFQKQGQRRANHIFDHKLLFGGVGLLNLIVQKRPER